MYKKVLALSTFPLLLANLPAFAAKPIDLSQQPVSALNSFLSTDTNTRSLTSIGKDRIKELKRFVDFKRTLHVRIQQTYSGFPVWGGDAILHVPQADKTDRPLAELIKTAAIRSMNGTIYQSLSADLDSAPSYVQSETQAQKAFDEAVRLYEANKGKLGTIENKQTKLMVYIDEAKKAHWAFLVSFDTQPDATTIPERPTYLMDATSFQAYKEWNDMQTLTNVTGGGNGGNTKTGKYNYDGLRGDFAALGMQRNDIKKICYLQNNDVVVKDARNRNTVVEFACNTTDKLHNNVYWDASLNIINGGYSPDNDALYAGNVVKDMYLKWYHLPVIVQNGKPMLLVMISHYKQVRFLDFENAAWDGKQMLLGDGGDSMYPLTSLGVIGHEVSHGFTQQHSNLVYTEQSGGLNESFSDMAAQAVEYYTVGKSSWQIGGEIMKQEGVSLRYMNDPTKDCIGKKPGAACSIDNVNDYNGKLDVHYTSGVFNYAYYLLATSIGWNSQKAFDVMVQANMSYWTSTSTFQQAACGVVKATRDYGYDVFTVSRAFGGVGIDTSKC